MRRVATWAATGLGVWALLLAARPGPPATAQTAAVATPPAVSSAAVSALPAGGGLASLAEYRLPPGGSLTLGPDTPPLLVLAVEAGAVRVTGPSPATVQRAGGPGGAPGQTETLAAGATGRLGQGDSLVSLAPAGSVLGNDGPVEAVLLAVGIRPAVAGMASPVAATGLALAVAVVIPPACPAGTRPGSTSPAATPGGGGGAGGEGGVAMAVAAAPGCVNIEATPRP